MLNGAKTPVAADAILQEAHLLCKVLLLVLSTMRSRRKQDTTPRRASGYNVLRQASSKGAPAGTVVQVSRIAYHVCHAQDGSVAKATAYERERIALESRERYVAIELPFEIGSAVGRKDSVIRSSKHIASISGYTGLQAQHKGSKLPSMVVFMGPCGQSLRYLQKLSAPFNCMRKAPWRATVSLLQRRGCLPKQMKGMHAQMACSPHQHPCAMRGSYHCPPRTMSACCATC
eukprot:6210175-Pleurochrysis_carterae.AAC.1